MINGKYLWIKGCEGLGNRMLTLAAALEYGARNGRTVVVDWSDGYYAAMGENAFPLFFESDSILSELPGDTSQMSFYPAVVREWNNEQWNLYDKFALYYSNNPLVWLFARVRQFILLRCFGRTRMEWGTKTKPSIHIPFGSYLQDGIKEDVVLFSDFAPPSHKNTLPEHLRLRADIRQMMDDFMRENCLGANTLGLHVRATDKSAGRKLQRLIQKLPEFMREHDLNSIFLCTDNAAVEKLMQEKLGDKIRICTKAKNLPSVRGGGIHHWASAQNDRGVKFRMALDSIMDMFLLSHMEWLLWQKGSTFSAISCIFHENEEKCMPWQDC